VKIDRAGIIAYWTNPNRAPKDYPPQGMIRLSLTDVSFPDVSTLTETEKAALRDKVTPEVLLNEIGVPGEWIGPRTATNARGFWIQ
jgi:hypothetical protein